MSDSASEITSPPEPSILEALDALREQLATKVELDEIACSLSALEGLGLSKFDLVVHIERLRATNDATEQDGLIEENSLEALDLLYVSAGSELGLR